MIKEGTLTQWNDDKGFGFVSGQDGVRYFLHISAIKRNSKARPSVNDSVSFEAGLDAQGRPQALRACVGALARQHARRKPARSAALGPIDYLVLALLLPLLFIIFKSEHSRNLLIACLILSALAFIAYWQDKRRAQRDLWRTPEDRLHLFALAGGWPGAWLAQQLLRHKSQKLSFRLKYLASVVLNLVGLHYLTRWLAA